MYIAWVGKRKYPPQYIDIFNSNVRKFHRQQSLSNPTEGLFIFLTGAIYHPFRSNWILNDAIKDIPYIFARSHFHDKLIEKETFI